MKAWFIKYKKPVLLILTGALAIAGTYIGIDEEAQQQILKLIEMHL